MAPLLVFYRKARDSQKRRLRHFSQDCAPRVLSNGAFHFRAIRLAFSVH